MSVDELKDELKVHICKHINISKEILLNTEEAQQLRGLKQLNWPSSQTRPDMSFGVCKVNVSVIDAKINDQVIANKYIHKLKSKKVLLKFPGKYRATQCFSDAVCANLKNASSQG